jgi:hypothetical protein
VTRRPGTAGDGFFSLKGDATLRLAITDQRDSGMISEIA